MIAPNVYSNLLSVALNSPSSSRSQINAVTEQEKSHADYFSIWDDWQKKSKEGAGEQRDVCVARMKDCLQRNTLELEINGLGLTELPPELPPNITLLNAMGNRVTTLPAVWPAGITRLDVSYNQLTVLSALPEKLRNLDACFNQINHLSALLPHKIIMLDLSNNNLDALPETLPPFLRTLYVNDNVIRDLPAHIPITLRRIYASENRIVALKENYPPKLRILNLNGNLISTLPDNINSLPRHCSINLNNNPLTYTSCLQLESLEQQPSHRSTFIIFTSPYLPILMGQESLFAEVSEWLPEEGRRQVEPNWNAIELEENAHAFKIFLRRLGKTESVRKVSSFKHRVASWLGTLALDPDLRRMTFLIAKGATESCEDRVALAFNDMQKALIVNQVEGGKYDNRLSELILQGRKMFRLEQLEIIAQEKLVSLAKKSDVFIDEIDIYLAYQVKLRTSLQLTSFTDEMMSFDVANITCLELLSAYDRVIRAENNNFPLWFSQWSAWICAIQRIDKPSYERAVEHKYQALETITHEKLNEELKPLGLENDPDAVREQGKKIADDFISEIDMALTRKVLAASNALQWLNAKRD